VDNLFVIVVPGALAAGPDRALFWWSLAVSLLLADDVSFPVNRWLIVRGKRHAVVHKHPALTPGGRAIDGEPRAWASNAEVGRLRVAVACLVDVAVDERDGHGAFPDGGGDALDGAVAREWQP
jgi:hypothetical protein